jgi:hypothetical protein
VKRIFGISELIEPWDGLAAGLAVGPRLHRRSPQRQGTEPSAKIPTVSALGELLGRWAWRPIAPLTRRDPSESDLAWLEEEVAATLPAEYRQFLRTHGWCRFAEAMIFPLAAPAPWGGRAKICSFLGFSSEIRRDLAFLVTEVFSDQLPEGTIPIASDAAENLVLLGVAGAARDRVWFWDRECRGLDDVIDDMVRDLEAEGQDIVDEDEDQILRRWEGLFPQRLPQPLGFTNVYPVADSFAAFLGSLRAARP